MDRSQSSHERLVEQLRSAILSGEFEPDRVHKVKDVASILQVSRKPVREALIVLEGRRIVSFERDKGFRIVQNTTRDLEEIFQLRLLLEVPAVRQTTIHMTPALLEELRSTLGEMHSSVASGDIERMWEYDRRFHWLILAGTGNQRLAEYVDRLRDLVLLRGSTTVDRSRSAGDVVAEHDAILEPMEAKDANASASAMRQHLLQTAELLIAQEAGATVRYNINFEWVL